MHFFANSLFKSEFAKKNRIVYTPLMSGNNSNGNNSKSLGSISSGQIQRDAAPQLARLLTAYPVVTLTGPRQSGKTTLAKLSCPQKPYVSLEAPDMRRFAQEDPRGFVTAYRDGAVFDEIQRAPELTAYLQPLVDEDPTPGRFVLTGSQQFELMQDVSQSLAGRNGLLRLLPMSYAELVRMRPNYAKAPLDEVMLMGFYPHIHHRRLDASQALADYFATYVERDLRELAAVQDLQRFERFVRLCAGRCGQLLNLASLASDAGVSHNTATQWLDLLQTSCIVYLLPPWFSNVSKRLTKSRKLYFFDVGLAAWLLQIRSIEQLSRDPLRGALFENFIVMEALKDQWHFGTNLPLSFYRESSGHEVDLLIPEGHRHHVIEIKSGATVNSDYFKGVKQFSKDYPQLMQSGRVIYGGESSQLRSDFPAHSWRELKVRPA
jgi:uncharacterized protein